VLDFFPGVIKERPLNAQMMCTSLACATMVRLLSLQVIMLQPFLSWGTDCELGSACSSAAAGRVRSHTGRTVAIRRNALNWQLPAAMRKQVQQMRCHRMANGGSHMIDRLLLSSSSKPRARAAISYAMFGDCMNLG
jgi:hypothetical protein